MSKPVFPNTSAAYEDTPKVTLAGQEFPIPLMAPRQNRILVPALMRMKNITKDELTTEQYDDFVLIIATALTRAHPDTTRDDVLDMPITVAEMMLAIPVIAQQTGVVKMVKSPLAVPPEGPPNP